MINFISKIINKINPDIVYTHFIGDSHLDHKCVAEATIISSRTVKEVYSFISNIYDTFPNFIPNYFVDISKTFNEKIELVNRFVSEKETHLNWAKQLKYLNGLYGLKQGTKYVEPFQVVKVLK